jgi:hypothetical protein
MLVNGRILKTVEMDRNASVYRTRATFPQNEIAAGATAEKFANDQAVTKNCANMILRIFLGGLLAVSVVRAKPQSGQPGPGGTHCLGE